MFSFPEKFQAEIIAISQLNKTTKSFLFKITKGKFNYKAGQFAMIEFEDPFEPGKQVQRAYSVASRPAGSEFELCIELIEGGRAGSYLKTKQVQDILNFKGPFGHCTLPTQADQDILLAATGTGIAPIKAILEDLAEAQATNKIQLYFGMRYLRDLYYLDVLQDLAAQLPNCKLHVCISQPETPDHPYLSGRIQTHFVLEDWHANMLVYACGNGNMVRDVRSTALLQNIDKKNILVEIFDS